MFGRLKHIFEYLGGAADDKPRVLPSPASPWWGLWWAALIVSAIAFSGQASKFIYIDF